ncbi:uncharacterized protein LOC122121208 [Dipodomys spectabilis]|uniref:uncharacterized protein LOC122121208 n=1 Tax=Dipodomys spectabilis TaxID=105255 RepID=UPI001C541CC7|nr:uncharacterized protein LOC122121208 [Dipodomys spectabilis]
MDSFCLNDTGSTIENKAMEGIISPMTTQLCHLLISMERKVIHNDVFASLEMMAAELTNASEEFVQVAHRLAGDSDQWLREEMKPVAESLILSGRNITLVAQRLHLQPESQCHREELVATAQQILVGTTKILLLENAAMARKTVRAAGWCLACLDALEAAEDASSLRSSLTDLAEALQRLGRLSARGRGREEQLGRAGRRLRGCVPALLAAARGHVRHPRDPQLAESRRHVFAQARKILADLLEGLEPGTETREFRTQDRAFSRRLGQLRELLAVSAPERLRGGLLDALPAGVPGHGLRLAACSALPERLSLVARCSQPLELGSASDRRLAPGEEGAALQAATEALSRGVRAGLLRQILDTFTDTHSPLERLLQAALATSTPSSPGDGQAWSQSLQVFLDAFQDQANQMLQVARLVLACCHTPQTGRDLEVAVAGIWGLVGRVQQLFSQSPQGSRLDCSPAILQDLLQAWAWASERLLACFDDVLNIPEFLNVSIQEMIRHLNLFMWAPRGEHSREFSGFVAYLQSRAAHIVQVMNRYVDQDRDPIFRNGLRVLIQQLEQSSLVLGSVSGHKSGYSPQDKLTVLTMAKHLIYSAQQIREGLDGTNHPDILSPLRSQVQRSTVAKKQCYFIFPRLQVSTATERKYQRLPGSEETDLCTSFLPKEPSSCCSVPDSPQKMSTSLPITSKLPLAVDSQHHQVVASVCNGLPEKDAAGEGPPTTMRMIGPQEIPSQTPSITDPAVEKAHSRTSGNNRLLEVAFQLSERTRESKQGLVTIAGDWYPLCQQLFCSNPTADLSENMAVFIELQQKLASVVQLTAKSGPTDFDKKDLDSLGHPETLTRMQGRLEEAEIHAKQLLDKILASDGLHAPKLWEESIENGCLLWSVAVQDLIQYMKRLSRRRGLFLLPLRQAVKEQQGLQEGLDQAVDVIQRLQGAARLSSLLCGDEHVKGEVCLLSREVHVLTDALADVAHILISSPKPSPSLSTRFELLCLELTLQAMVLTSHLSSINADYESAFQDAVCPMLPVCKNPQSRTNSFLESMVSGIQDVQEIIAKGQEPGYCQEDLTMALENLLITTNEVALKLPGLQGHPEEWGLHVLDWLRLEWAAKAHHAVSQLQAWQGGHTQAWRLLVQCLKPRKEPARASKQDLVQAQPHHKESSAGATAGCIVGSPGCVPRGTPGSSTGTCTAEPGITRTTTGDMGMNDITWPSPGCPDRPRAEMDQPLQEDGSTDSEDKITQLTQEMANEVLLMAKSLKKRGQILTKDQLITSARKTATSGYNFSRLICIIAKNCIDQRCSQELLCMVEQIQTMSNQLRIISSVKASLKRSKSSEELLVENAQQLLQAVSKTVRAAEAASLQGLRTPSLDPEELEVTAFCTQWRRKLERHRRQKISNVDCDELGLRKTSTKMPPALGALVQRAL